MYDRVTLKLNVDPLILSALREDITSEDVSANSIMKKPQAGEVDLICKQDGIICGLQVFERVFALLDDSTRVEFFAEDGEERKERPAACKGLRRYPRTFVWGAHGSQLSSENERHCHIYPFSSSVIKGD